MEVSPKVPNIKPEEVEQEIVEVVSSDCYAYTTKYGKKYGVSADLLNRIIYAESRGNPLAKNPDSTASGCGQFTKATVIDTQKHFGSTWDKWNPEHSVEAMAWWISRGYIQKWYASKHIWDK